MTAPELDSAEIAKRLKAILDYVQDCERRVNQGEIMDLQGLDDNVIVLCEAIAALPRTEAQDFEDEMATLIENLEMLAQSMRAQEKKMMTTGGGAR